jgi:hypothetical protein
MEGRCLVPAVGSVVAGRAADLPFVVVDADGREVEPVSAYLRDLALGDASRLTCRSYAFDLLRWHRLLWMLKTPWEKATEAEVAVLAQSSAGSGAVLRAAEQLGHVPASM